MLVIASNQQQPPPLERFSAEKFRQWLAGMVSDEPPSKQTDRDAMKAALIDFLSICPMVYDLRDRMVIWEKIGNAAIGALESCNNNLLQWVNEVLSQIDAKPGKVATCEELRAAIATFDKPDWWQVECLRVMRELCFVLPPLAREKWSQYKQDNSTEFKLENHHADE